VLGVFGGWGYQEQATLSVNVKRWFGCSPRAYRTKKMLN